MCNHCCHCADLGKQSDPKLAADIRRTLAQFYAAVDAAKRGGLTVDVTLESNGFIAVGVQREIR